jgi:predicted DNA-binding transcriptional regulator YafY
MFTSAEADAIAIGVRLLRRLRDAKLQQAAESVLAKLAVVVPEPLQPHLVSAPIYVSEGDAPPVTGLDPAVLRDAIHQARKVAIAYIDEHGRHTQRTIRPIAMAYYVDVTVLGAWCELRNDFRNFRVDRISDAQLLDERFVAESSRLLAEWLALPKHRSEESTVEPDELVSGTAAM